MSMYMKACLGLVFEKQKWLLKLSFCRNLDVAVFYPVPHTVIGTAAKVLIHVSYIKFT